MTVQHVNPSVDYCKNSFSELHSALGDDVVRQLLLQTSIFLPLNHGNLWQITGVPINRMDKKRKRSELDPTSTWTRAKRRTLLYSNSFIPKVGLGKDHVLVRTTDPEQILLSIFNDLLCANAKKAQETGHERWVRMLKNNLLAHSDSWSGAIRVAADLSLRHRLKCDYHRLLERHCPLPTERIMQGNQIESNEAVKKELGKLATEGYSASTNVESFLRSVLSHVFIRDVWGCKHNESQIYDVLVPKLVGLRRHEHFANKTLLLNIRVLSFRWLIPLASFQKEDTSNTRELRLLSKDHHRLRLLVLSFLRWVFNDFLLNLLRSVFFVTDSEFSGKKLLYYRKPVWSKFRSLSLQQLINRRRQFEYLNQQHLGELLLDRKMGVSRLRLLPKSTGVRPIAALCKSERLLPARSATKQTLTAQHLADDSYVKVTDEVEEDDEPLDASEVEKLWPVFDVSRLTRVNRDNPGYPLRPTTRMVPTNTILSDLFAILRFESNRNEGSFGSGLDGLHYFYPRYAEFIKAFKMLPISKRSIYFASVDINQCFDSIDQNYLMALLENILADEQYVLQRYRVVHPFNSMGRLVKRHKKRVISIEELSSFTSYLSQMSNDYESSVFSDGSSCSMTRRDEMIKLLHDHLTKHIVSTGCRFGPQYLRQTIGIPQGSVLSNMLCNLYYGSIEKELLHSEGVMTKSRALLARMVDDFIFVTHDSTERMKFLKKMKEGHPTLGVQINKEKTHVLPSCKDYKSTTEGTKFPWCGMLFDVNSGEVVIDYQRFLQNESVFSFIVDRAAKPGKHLANQMKTFVRPRCLAILFDAAINSVDTQYLNFYQLMAYAALKTLMFLKAGDIVDTVCSNEQFLLKEIQSTTLYALNLICERLKRANSGRCLLQRKNALNAGWAAFADVCSHDNQFHFLRDAARNNLKGSLPSEFYNSMEETIRYYMYQGIDM
ncbi:telomerase reverse transcriptase [Fistulifera solaris]|uniref:Telomerase reverse transcriptase n=1 Tax=Fistulifera solaris TaxID=1519565 RepID=A0A1Z5KLG2_FISSO|nr:telomerase reverse transcriptase [Fistulifera solaris]|eukprot:GAX27116.1 telomerase reverse transcriptase [Fistulifera solaris]